MNSNPTPDPRAELEARLTALLLGELSPAEAAELNAALARDPQLAQLHARLQQTIHLVREATAAAPEAVAGQAEAPRLSADRRAKLLAHFKTAPMPTTKQATPSPRQRELKWTLPLGLAAALVGLISFASLRLNDSGDAQKAMTPIPNSRYDFIEGAKTADGEQRVQLSGKVDTVRRALSPDAPAPSEPERSILAKTTPPPPVVDFGIVLPAIQSSTTWASQPADLARQNRFPGRYAFVTDGTSGSALAINDDTVALGILGQSQRGANRGVDSDLDGYITMNTSGRALVTSAAAGNKAHVSDPVAFSSVVAGANFNGNLSSATPARTDAPVAINNISELSLGTSLAARPPLTVTGSVGGAGQLRGQLPAPVAATPATTTPTSGEIRSVRGGNGAMAGTDIVSFGSGAIVLGGSSGAAHSFAGDVAVTAPPGLAPAPAAPVPLALGEVGAADQQLADRQSLMRRAGNSRLVAENQPESLGLTKAGAGTLTLSGANTFTGGVVLNGGTIRLGDGDRELSERPAPTPIALPESVLAQDRGQLRALRMNGSTRETPATSPSETEADVRLASAPKLYLAYDGKSGAGEIAAWKQAKGEKEAEGRAEIAARNDLEKLEAVRDTINLQVMQEKIDSSLGRSTSVVIADPAKASSSDKPTLWQRLTGTVERTARIAIDRDSSDVAGVGGRQNAFGYDPYFIQTEAEKIQSKAVLLDTIERLKLNEKWAEKSGSTKPLKTSETYDLLKRKLNVSENPKNKLMEIRIKSDQAEEAALIANTIAESYRDTRLRARAETSKKGIEVLAERAKEMDAKVAEAKKQLAAIEKKDSEPKTDDFVPRKPAANAPVPKPEVLARENKFSTFSLNVSDVSFKLAAASLEKGQMPDPATVRSEEFINAFDYRDPEPLQGVPIGFAWERAHYPFAHNRDLLRFSVKTAALGRQAGRPLNVVLLLDNSGSMERADRVRIVREALRMLASQLQAQDKLSVITFARTPRLWVDGVSGDQAGKVAEQVGAITPEGGTNLEEAMNLGYQTALRHYLAGGINHVVLLTDGAANLGNVEPESLKQKVEAHRKQGIALDCFGVGWEGFNDDLLEVLARNGDGRYGFINTPEEAATQFAGQLAGALHVAASDVKVQVEFNPRRVTSYRQIGYAKHQLTKEQFRDNTVDAAELAAQEAGNALYTIETNPRGEGPVCTVRVRFKVPGTGDYREHSWDVPFTGNAVSLEQASHPMRLAATASAFSEWLVASPFAGEVTLDRLLTILSGIPEIYGADARQKKLEEMIRQAKSVSGR